ncbi:hypothetical protein Y032_0350g3214 [Ancylostoma ceylanicum]|uniref:Uncharacterized protein n=1 Tax=Ancylostoma ceylanicum TaxID=53326 RepID=A0A016RWS6_9BILA|nr:hypothetical protein Y032_0350g3214 [Ancylostoma ceylanicum]
MLWGNFCCRRISRLGASETLVLKTNLRSKGQRYVHIVIRSIFLKRMELIDNKKRKGNYAKGKTTRENLGSSSGKNSEIKFNWEIVS